MRIAMMTNNYLPYVGGVPISVDRLARSLRGLEHDVDIFAPSYGQEGAEQGVIRCRSFKRKHDTFCTPNPLDRNIEDAFRKNSYDLIHVHHPMVAGYAALRMAKKHAIPLAFTYHTRYEQYLHHFGALGKMPGAQGIVTAHNRLFINKCDLVFAPTGSMRTYLEQVGINTPVEILPTGLAAEDFVVDRSIAATIRNGLAYGRDRLYCTVSRLEKEKNVSFLIDAFAHYKQICGHTFRLLVIGEGSERPALERQAAQLGLEDDILFTGNFPHSELSAWYGACDAFVFASKSETQGIVMLEAMAAGTPVFAVEASGVNDLVQNAYNGYRIPDHPNAFAQVLSLLADMPCRLQALEQGALQTAHAYSAKKIAQKALANYESLLAQKEADKYAYNAI